MLLKKQKNKTKTEKKKQFFTESYALLEWNM